MTGKTWEFSPKYSAKRNPSVRHVNYPQPHSTSTSPGLQTPPADTAPTAGDGGVQMRVLPEHETPWAHIKGFGADLQCW